MSGEVTGTSAVTTTSSTVPGLVAVVGSLTAIVAPGSGVGPLPAMPIVSPPIAVIPVFISVVTTGSGAGTDHVPPTSNCPW